MNKFIPKCTKYIFNIGTGTLHYYNTQSCYNSKHFNPNDTNLKFYNSEDDAIRDNQSHLKKCKLCFKNR